MPPPDLSQKDILALAQDKALAQSGIDPFEASPASAFLEDELGGYYHRLGGDRRNKQRNNRGETYLNDHYAKDHNIVIAGTNPPADDSSDGEAGGVTCSRLEEEEEGEEGEEEQAKQEAEKEEHASGQRV